MTENSAPKAKLPLRLLRGLGSEWQLSVGLLAVLPISLAPGIWGNSYWSYIFGLLNIFIIASVGQNFLVADARQVSFGQGAVLGLGAYASALFLFHFSVSYAVALAAAVGAGLLAGVMLALPALRVSGFYFGFVTLAFALVLPDIINELRRFTRGVTGINYRSDTLRTPLVGALTPMQLMAAVFAAGSLLGLWWFRRTRTGIHIRIAGESPEGAASLGINAGLMRLIAFVIACGLAGLSGGLYVGLVEYVGPSAFTPSLSLFLFFTIVVGGSGQLLGPIIGVWVLYMIPNVWFVSLVDYRELGYGITALVVMLLFKDGVVGFFVKLFRRASSRPQPPSLSLANQTLDLADQLARAHLEGVQVSDRISSTPALILNGVSKRFGNVVALDCVTLEIRQRGIVALVGPNGSGKTTLLNVISGFIQPDSGTLRIFGRDSNSDKPHRRAREGLGRTFQTPRMYRSLTATENILVASKSQEMFEIVRQIVPAHLEEIEVDQVSHSQRRLVEILRMMAMDSEIILLDEPAAGLSPAEREEFVHTLKLVAEKLHKTVIIVEHDLRLIRAVADRAIVLNNGVVVADGAPDELLTDASVEALFTGRPVNAQS